jgi:protein gp37
MSWSEIGWTDYTWNPVVGCSKCSKGCDDCYAIRQALRCAAMGIPQYQGLTIIQGGRPNWTGKVRLIDHKLHEPLHWRKPRMVFVNSTICSTNLCPTPTSSGSLTSCTAPRCTHFKS